MIKIYICKFCKFRGSRKQVRLHITKKHLSHSSIHQKDATGKVMPSSITENTLSEEFK